MSEALLPAIILAAFLVIEELIGWLRNLPPLKGDGPPPACSCPGCGRMIHSGEWCEGCRGRRPTSPPPPPKKYAKGTR